MRSIYFSLFLFVSLGIFSQTTIREVFKEMPDSIVPYLTTNNRMDFIDFMDSGMKAEVTNLLEGKSKMLKLTDTYLSVSLNEASSIEMRLLDVSAPVDSATQIVCLIRTYGSDVRESTVDFYSLKWHKLQTADYVTLPSEMYCATIGEQEPTLTLIPECRLDAPANEEQKEEAKPSIILKWNGASLK